MDPSSFNRLQQQTVTLVELYVAIRQEVNEHTKNPPVKLL